MKKMLILPILVIVILFNVGCGGSSDMDNRSTLLVENNSIDITSTSIDVLSEESNSSNNTNTTLPAPSSVVIASEIYENGEFGEIELNSTYEIPKDAIFLDIRNDWERVQKWKEESDKSGGIIWNNSKLALGSIGGAVYEYRDEEGNKKKKVREEFIDEVLAISKDNKQQRLVLICNSSSRTKKASKLLSDNNFTFVEHIVGGISAWRDANLPTATFDTVELDGDYNVSKNTLFLDIRNDWERADQNYAKGSIGGAVYEYRNEKDKKDRKVRSEFVSEVLALCEDNRSKPIVLICQSSSRTLKASKLLVENGFIDVTHIKGGLSDWKSSGLPIGE